jgi:hypothetical protein
MTVKELIRRLKDEDQNAEVLMREPYDDATEYVLSNVLRRRVDGAASGDSAEWEIVVTP